MKTTQLLTVVVILQALILAGQWLGGTPALVTPAHAQIPDPGAQQLQVIKELQTLNGKMDRLVGILESGKLEVRVQGADDNKAGRR